MLPMPTGTQSFLQWPPVRAILVNEQSEHLLAPVPVFSLHLDTVGDGTGTFNAVGNYSDAGDGETEFKLVVQNDRVEFFRLLITIEDASGFRSDIYGSGGALTNGISLDHRDANGQVLGLFTDVHTVKQNADWAMYCYDVDVKSWRTGGAGNELLVARWTFARMGAPIRCEAGHSMVLTLHDDFSGLIMHHFVVQGTGPVR